uniref:Ribonuclease H-like domain-containing protein n=1 Tax=Tanacetum cinerariifolium TaxID=118510 RepID=A0A6L2NGJ5_TANCI|nr:ribonuclease H-like domain-containing protein [Tanacetum cinerariifolium]
MWLYKHKYNTDGSLNRYKARLVANGCSQQQGIVCDETFSPVVKPATIRTVLSLAVSRQWPIHQLDVKNASLYGHLTEILYMYQPLEFTDSAHSDYDCLLEKSLYGLKKPPELGFNDFLAMLFELKKYAIEILEQPQMLNCNPCTTPIDTEKKLGPEGSSVNNPTLYRSLAGSLQSTISQLIAYSDADWAGCPATRRSTSGYCIFLVTTSLSSYAPIYFWILYFLGDNLVTWSSKRQDTLSCSSAEAEYHVVANAVAETSGILQHQRTKHIEIDINFVCDKVAAGHVRVFHVSSRFQYADIFTKGLP